MHDTLKHIIAHGSPEDMNKLSALFTEAYESSDDRTKKHIFHKMHHMAYGPHLSPEMADAWTSHMKNKDGSMGPHWQRHQTDPLAENRDKNDFFAVLNMMYSDYFSPSLTQAQYIALAKDFIDDVDAPEDKTLKYYCDIVKKW